MHGEPSPQGRRLSAILALAALVLVLSSDTSCTAGLRDSFSAVASAQVSGATPRVNAPYFEGDVRFPETAIFWFGRITANDNYADVRVGYNDDELYVRLAAFDRWLWYDPTPSAKDLTAWDAATLYLDLDGNEGETPDASAYRFVGQLNWWEERELFQTAYRGDGSGWVRATIPFTTTSGWRGNAPNNNEADDRGWELTFRVPFAGLGLSRPASRGTVWAMAMTLHDRDDGAGTPIADDTWPEAPDFDRSSTWGQLAFGLPIYAPPATAAGGTVAVRHKLNGTVVLDAAVGGTTGNLCPGDPDYIWNEWGNDNFAGAPNFNIQNQSDVADWPCFSKYYVTFPLDKVPPGQAIVSATLKLHQYGNAGGGTWGEPEPSLIQVVTVAEDWEEKQLTWNNAPLATENVSAAWVDPIASFPGWPGSAREWNVSGAVAQAYAAGEPLRLALYEADGAYHSGKYFVSSDTGDWNEKGRPTLSVVWGLPLAAVRKEVWPVALTEGQNVTYTLSLLGNGHPLTLTDDLPAQVSAPGVIQVSGGAPADYDSGLHRLRWSDSPGPGHPVTITCPVTVQVAGPQAIFNTAVLTDADGTFSASTAWFVVDAQQVWLPITWRSN